MRASAIVMLSALLLSAPAYFILRNELTDPEGPGRLLPGIPIMLLSPAIGFPIPLALILIVALMRQWRLTLPRAAMFGACAVLLYVFVISIYVAYLQQNFARVNPLYYLLIRLCFSLPSLVAAMLATVVAAWISKLICKSASRM